QVAVTPLGSRMFAHPPPRLPPLYRRMVGGRLDTRNELRPLFWARFPELGRRTPLECGVPWLCGLTRRPSLPSAQRLTLRPCVTHYPRADEIGARWREGRSGTVGVPSAHPSTPTPAARDR